MNPSVHSFKSVLEWMFCVLGWRHQFSFIWLLLGPFYSGRGLPAHGKWMWMCRKELFCPAGKGWMKKVGALLFLDHDWTFKSSGFCSQQDVTKMIESCSLREEGTSLDSISEVFLYVDSIISSMNCHEHPVLTQVWGLQSASEALGAKTSIAFKIVHLG